MNKMSLAALRVNAKLTQEGAATKIGVSRASIIKWEKGISYPSAKRIGKICEVYGCSYDDIQF